MRQTRESSAPEPPRLRRVVLQSIVLALVATTGGAGITLANAETRFDAGSKGTTSAAPTASDRLPAPADQPRPAAAPDAARGTVMAAAGYLARDVTEIPLSALTAYQRSEAVMAGAMPKCRLDWTVLAAVGQVLTDHGQQDGASTIDQEGKVDPAIVGPAIRDNRGQRLPDSDHGDLDGSRDHDRALGPMLLAPAAWRDIGVDGDADGTRDPQDIDDAALATAVLLCVEGENLERPRQLTRALERINDTEEFVTAVPEIAAAYAADFAAPDAAAPPQTISVGAMPATPSTDKSARKDASDDHAASARDAGAGDDRGQDSTQDSAKSAGKDESKGEKASQDPESEASDTSKGSTEGSSTTESESDADDSPTESEPTEPEPTEPELPECDVEEEDTTDADDESTTGPGEGDTTGPDEDATPAVTETPAASDETADDGEEPTETTCAPEDGEPVEEETDSPEPAAPCADSPDSGADDDTDDDVDDDLNPCPDAPQPTQQP